MSDEKRAAETRRREQADSAGLGDELSAAAIKPREIGSVLTVRLEPQLMKAVRAEASRRNLSVSDVVRVALSTLLEANEEPRVVVSIEAYQTESVGSGIRPSLNSASYSVGVG
jgi:hypothetical protein